MLSSFLNVCLDGRRFLQKSYGDQFLFHRHDLTEPFFAVVRAPVRPKIGVEGLTLMPELYPYPPGFSSMHARTSAGKVLEISHRFQVLFKIVDRKNKTK